MFWKKCSTFIVLTAFIICLVSSQDRLNLQPDFGDQVEQDNKTVNLQPNLGENIKDNVRKDCDCIPFYQCKNGSVNRDGSGIFTIRKQDDSCPIVTEICCNITSKSPVTLSTHSSSVFITTEQPLQPIISPLPPRGCGYRNPNGVGFKVTGNPENEAQFGEFPWVVALMKESDPKPSCGGALIHPLAVLTAAHCIKNNTSYFVRVGEWDINNANEPLAHQDIQISEIKKHPQFYKLALFYDVAFIYLASEVVMHPHISTICLPPKDVYKMDARRCFSSGWGKKEFGKKGSYSIVLKKVDLPQIPSDTCQNLLRKTRLGDDFILHNSFLCAGGEKGKDTCDGDGGSPLVCPLEDEGMTDRFYQAGIVSWGIGCGDENIPGVYASVARIRDWIDEEMFLHGLDYKSYEY